jgi:acyl-coenzyme A thioesterase PaaI-like protein
VTEPFPTLDSFRCFACSPDHPKGLRLRFREAGAARVRCDVTLDGDYEGLGGVIHGGIVATVFDETMAWCLYRHRYRVYVTASMSQRYRAPVPVGEPLTVEAWIEDGFSTRRIRVAAAIRSSDGRTLAQGEGLFVLAPPSMLDEMDPDQRAGLERVFAEFAARDGSG